MSSAAGGQSNRLPMNVSMLSPWASCWPVSPWSTVAQAPSGFGLSPKLDVQRCPYISVIFTQSRSSSLSGSLVGGDDCVDAVDG
ncbi:hypothetical protein N5K55_05970 [Pseudomonas aeruginosa]|nr:hypothetical protein [Pseudomonas aeruginosa]